MKNLCQLSRANLGYVSSLGRTWVNINISQHTIVFDRGCNSKDNLKKVTSLKMHYIGALTPFHHEELIFAAEGKYTTVQVDDKKLEVYREKTNIWEEERSW